MLLFRTENIRNLRKGETKMSNGKIIGIFAAIGVAVILITVGVIVGLKSCGGSDLESLVPEEVLKYDMMIDGQKEHKCNIDSFDVEKRDKADKYETAYCKIEMSDEYIAKTVYLKMNLVKTNNGWKVDSYDTYKKGSMKILDKQKVGEGAANEFAKDKILTNPQCNFISDEEMEVSYTPSIEHKFLKISGQVKVTFIYSNEGGIDSKDSDYYRWVAKDYDIDYSDISYSWEIAGNWKADVESYHWKLNFTKNTGTNYTIHGSDGEFYEDTFDEDLLFDDDDPHKIPLEKEEYDEFKEGITIEYPDLNLFITPTELKLGEAGFMYTNGIEKASTMTQY